MTDRERLLEILNKPIFPHEMVDPLEAVADYLLDNGVTFCTPIVPGHDDQFNIAEMSYNNGYVKGLEDGKPKWSPASEPPKEWKDENGNAINFLVSCSEFGVDIGNWIEFAKSWYVLSIPVKCTHWMPLPEPPKEGV